MTLGRPREAIPLYERLLRVHCVSGERMEGTLGDNGDEWPGMTAWAGALSDGDAENLRGQRGLNQM